MKALLPVLGLLAALSASGCDGKDSAAEAPPPVALTAEAIGHYCGMALLEHEGPKGQILLRGSDRPVWFSSARDTIAFTMLAEEAKTLRAIYVSDMGRAESWDQPGATNGGGAPRAVVIAAAASAAWARRRRCPSPTASGGTLRRRTCGRCSPSRRSRGLGLGDDGSGAAPAEPAPPRHTH